MATNMPNNYRWPTMPFIISLVLLLAPYTALVVRCHHWSSLTIPISAPSPTCTTTPSIPPTPTFGNGALGQSLTASQAPSSSTGIGAASTVSSTSHRSLIVPVIALSICLGILLCLLVFLSLLLYIRRRRRLQNATAAPDNPFYTETRALSVAPKSTSSAHAEENHPEINALVQQNELSKQAIAKMVPMKPKDGQVLPGYNPTLDEKRPQKIEEYLQKYHILFVVDDSGSMSGDRWIQTRDALSEIAHHALVFHSDTVDICFFNDPRRYSGLKGVQDVMRTFELVKISGEGTPTGRVLEKILSDKICRLDQLAEGRHREYSSERPLDIIVLTDGVPDEDSPPAPVIDEAARQMRAKMHHPNWIGIQFVQIGNDSAAEPTLRSLIDSTEHNMVDTISYEDYREEGGGRLTAAVLEQIILGGLHPNLRLYWNRHRPQP